MSYLLHKVLLQTVVDCSGRTTFWANVNSYADCALQIFIAELLPSLSEFFDTQMEQANVLLQWLIEQISAPEAEISRVDGLREREGVQNPSAGRYVNLAVVGGEQVWIPPSEQDQPGTTHPFSPKVLCESHLHASFRACPGPHLGRISDVSRAYLPSHTVFRKCVEKCVEDV